MKYGKTKLIAENIAPTNANSIAVFNGNIKICNVEISKLKPDLGTKLYSFGLVSDIHLDGGDVTKGYFNDALSFFENQGCDFCCHAGDMTNIGFWYNSNDTDIYLTQMESYKSVINAHLNLPIYGICGNHESYNKSIMDNLAELKSYADIDLFYSYTHRDDIFIFIGQPSGTPYANGKYDEWVAELKWLQKKLEENRNKRCFVFEHLTLSDDSGNPKNIHNAYWVDLEETLVEIMGHYKNAILFHGHSHLDLNEQLNFSYSNYSTKKGFKSISIPSSVGSRNTINGVLQKVNDPAKRSGYIVDVYENFIVLKGYNFHQFTYIPIAQYYIDTTLKTIDAETFADSTGKIIV